MEGNLNLRKYFRKKLIAGALLFFFVSGGNVYPQQTSPTQEPVSSVGQGVSSPSVGIQQVGKNVPLVQSDLNPYNITVPEQFGNIEEIFQGAQNSPLIVHIQNVHANYEAQVNIKAILNHLVEKYKFSLIQLEGAVSKLDPAVLEPSYLKEANLKLVDFLMREGRITGADAFAVETDKPVELYGIEDLGLYMENLKTFKAVYQHQSEVKTYFDEVHRLILNIGPKLLDPELLDFTRKTEEFAGDKIDILDYLVYMNKLSEKHQLTSLNDMKEIVHYPNLVRLMRLHRLEEQLDKSGLKKEMEALKLEFRKKMPDSEKVEKLLARLDDSAKGVTPRSYFLELTKAADEAKIDFIGYPAFRIFTEFLIHQDEIDHRGLFNELKQFENFLQGKLFSKDDEKTLLQIIDFVGLLEQYFRLEMSREKLVLYLDHRKEITPSWIAERLEELAKKYEVATKPVGDLQKLDSYMNELEYFYQLVLKRDEIFSKKILSKMKALQQDKTVIITGGFHKDGLMDHFRKENISYIVINPKVDVKQGSENYLKVMLDEDAVVGSVFAGTFAIEVKELLASLLQVDRDRLALRNFYAAVAPVAFTLDKRDREIIIQATNEQFRKIAAVSGVLLNVTSAEVVGKVVNLNVEVALEQEGRERRYSLDVVYSANTQSFEVKVIRELPPAGELKKVWILPPTATQTSVNDLNSNLVNEAKAINFSLLANRPVEPVKQIRLSQVQNFVVDTFIPENGLLEEEALVKTLSEAPARAIKRIRQNLERGGGSITMKDVEEASQQGERVATTSDVANAGLPQDLARVWESVISSTVRTPQQFGYAALSINPQQENVARAELRALLGLLRSETKMAASVFGPKDITRRFVLETFGITDEEAKRSPYNRLRIVESANPVSRMEKDLFAVEPLRRHLSETVSPVPARNFLKRVGLQIPPGAVGDRIRDRLISVSPETFIIRELNPEDQAVNGNPERLEGVRYIEVRLLKLAGIEGEAVLHQIADIASAMQKMGFNEWQIVSKAVNSLLQAYQWQRQFEVAA